MEPIRSLTLFGTVFKPAHTGVCWCLEACTPEGARILICNRDCEGLPTARDWLLGAWDEDGNLMFNQFSDGRREQVLPFGTVAEIADLFAGVPSLPVRIACTYGVGA